MQLNHHRLALWERIYRFTRWGALLAVGIVGVNALASGFPVGTLPILIIALIWAAALWGLRSASVQVRLPVLITGMLALTMAAGMFLVDGYLNFMLLIPIIGTIGLTLDNPRFIVINSLLAAVLLIGSHMAYLHWFAPAEPFWMAMRAALLWGFSVMVVPPFFLALGSTFRHALAETEQRREAAETLQATLQTNLVQLNDQVATQDRLLELVQDLETPIIPVLDDVLALPIIGVLDPERLQRLATALLEQVSAQHAALVLLDLTAARNLEPAVVQGLVGLAQAVRLLGAQCMLTGIRPDTALVLARLGIAQRDLPTAASLREGIQRRLRLPNQLEAGASRR